MAKSLLSNFCFLLLLISSFTAFSQADYKSIATKMIGN